MAHLSRRDFVVSAGLATALGLNSRLVISPAFAQKTPDTPKGFVTYQVGSAKVTALYDGIWEKAHDPAFIANASVDDVKAAKDYLESKGVKTMFGPFPVEEGPAAGQTITYFLAPWGLQMEIISYPKGMA